MTKSLFWNIRGLSKPSNFRRVKNLMRSHKIQIFVLCETKVDVGQLEVFRVKLRFDEALSNEVGSGWMFYNNPFQCSLIGEGSQHISVVV